MKFQAQIRDSRSSGIRKFALTVLCALSILLPGCEQELCRLEDPFCSESSLLTLWALAQKPALYYGNSLDLGFYRMDLESQSPVNLFTTSTAVSAIGFSSSGSTVWFVSNNGRDVSRASLNNGSITLLRSDPPADYWGMRVVVTCPLFPYSFKC